LFVCSSKSLVPQSSVIPTTYKDLETFISAQTQIKVVLIDDLHATAVNRTTFNVLDCVDVSVAQLIVDRLSNKIAGTLHKVGFITSHVKRRLIS
jgi:hypothetical protein